MSVVRFPGRRAPLAVAWLAASLPSLVPALAGAQPAPAREGAPSDAVHFQAEGPGYSLDRWRPGQPATPLCALPCDLRPGGAVDLLLRRPDGRDARFPREVPFRAGDSVRLRYVSHEGRRVAGYVTGGLVLAGWITAFALLIAHDVDLTLGTGGGSHANPLGFLYGFAVAATLAPSLALATTPDDVALDVARGPRPRAAAPMEGTMLRFATAF